uniref:CSN8/PSMD8/EIF3K domain-containing protein n=1 Tax=Arion vulgaris TaxID=1028688 RepID=A0A0B6ZRB0_9EUPU
MASSPRKDGVLSGNDIERQELECGSSPCTPKMYSQLLAIYLLENDLCFAKFLWKRIPQSVKQNCPELANIWSVGQKMWLKDYAGIYEALQRDWSEDVQHIMAAVVESVRQRALKLVRLAYSSISADDFAIFISMPVEKAVQAAQEEGWEVDLQNLIITPKKLDPVPAVSIMNEQHLSVLTDYVTFMEN